MCHGPMGKQTSWAGSAQGTDIHLTGTTGMDAMHPRSSKTETLLLSAQVGAGSEDTREFGSRTAQKEGQQALQTGRERLLEERDLWSANLKEAENTGQREAQPDEPETEPDHGGGSPSSLCFHGNHPNHVMRPALPAPSMPPISFSHDSRAQTHS